jgi:NADH-quinone oxidoreductase subunit N
MNEVLASLSRFQPEVALTVGLLLVVLVDASGAAWRHAANRLLTLAALAAALGLALRSQGPWGELWQGMVVLDPLAVFFKALLAAAALLVVLAFRNARELAGLGMGEFYALMLALTLANLLLAASNDLAMLYLSIEMVSITSYVLVAYMKGDRMSNEASLKYLLFGAVSTGAMLYGLSLLYGLAGTTSLPAIREQLAAGLSDQNRFAVYMIALFVFAGFGFKTAAVPFHFWCPDVYQGAPTPVTAFLSVAPKAAGFAIMLRFFFSGLAQPETGSWDLASSVNWPMLLALISALTMTLGNVAALTQTNMKRLLAYSSIAHAGYMLMGVVALSEQGARGMLVYLLCYLFMNLGAFLVVMLIHHHDGTFDLRDYPGLYRRAPGLTLAMAVFLLSLMGIPPLVGFMAKLYVFAALIDRAAVSPDGAALYTLAVIGAVNAAVAAFYYARVLKTMIIDEGDEARPLVLALADRAWVYGLAVANLVPVLWWNAVEGGVARHLVLYAGR